MEVIYKGMGEGDYTENLALLNDIPKERVNIKKKLGYSEIELNIIEKARNELMKCNNLEKYRQDKGKTAVNTINSTEDSCQKIAIKVERIHKNIFGRKVLKNICKKCCYGRTESGDDFSYSHYCSSYDYTKVVSITVYYINI
ncbi:MAG: hypothetical protein LBQ34_01915 [Alphaproteobacteria bacterium]|jgi:hypothetical protein|nr:hypothetical protein [Alphaproteobacteria bacterium]